MINDETFAIEEAEIQKIFAEAGWSEVPKPNELRIQQIEERAINEMIIKESIDFVFNSFEQVLGSFASTFLGSRESNSGDYRI